MIFCTKMHLDPAVISVTMIFPLALSNVVLPLFGVKKGLFRVFLGKISQKRPLRTVKGTMTLLCGLLGSVEAFSLSFLDSTGPFEPTNEISNLYWFHPLGEKFLG